MVSSATFFLVFKKVTVRLAWSYFVWYPAKSSIKPLGGGRKGWDVLNLKPLNGG